MAAVFSSGVIVLPDAGHSQDEPRAIEPLEKLKPGKCFLLYILCAIEEKQR